MATTDQKQFLSDAVARNLSAVLSLPSAGLLRHCKSRFLAESDEGLTLEANPAERPLLAELIAGQTACAVAFKQGNDKRVFAARPLRFEPAWRINADTAVPAVLLAWPGEIKAVQRRSTYRVALPRDSDVRARCWRMGPAAVLADPPPAAAELSVEARDLSVGGIGLRFSPRDGDAAPKVSVEDRLRVQIACGDVVLLIEGQMRPPAGGPAPNGSVLSGVVFRKLQDDLAGRQTLAKLTRIVGELQRDEARRVRAGLMASA